jgi:hypothetical protein
MSNDVINVLKVTKDDEWLPIRKFFKNLFCVLKHKNMFCRNIEDPINARWIDIAEEQFGEKYSSPDCNLKLISNNIPHPHLTPALAATLISSHAFPRDPV